MIDFALSAYLTSYPGLASLVGDRIYPLVLPQSPILPAITINRVSTTVERDLFGAVRTRVRMQLTCFARSTATNSGYSLAKLVARQVREALQDYTGEMGDVTILEAHVLGEMDEYESDLGQYIIPVDVMFLIEGGNA